MQMRDVVKTEVSDISTYHIWTFGCQMNKADSEMLEGGFEELGLVPSSKPEDADVAVVNTCVVRQAAEDAATGLLGRLRPRNGKRTPRMIAVMGCMVGPDSKTLRRRFPQVDVWARPQQFSPILEMTASLAGRDPDGCLTGRTPSSLGVSAYLTVVHGCDKFCTFCIIPYRRGREFSRSTKEIVEDVRVMVGRGVKEVTLLGQNVDSYGHDLRPRRDLADLLEDVNEVEGLERIRFLTSHPNDMSRRILEAVKSIPKVCENINLPFQAGNDRVLADMRRGYTRTQYLEKVAEVREIIPNVALVTDVIAGFPSETTKDFEDTLDILERVVFDKVHAAAYSERPGAYAARRIKDDIPREEKKRRMSCIITLQETLQRKRNLSLIGKKFNILINNNKDGNLSGRTRGDILVYVKKGVSSLGENAKVRIISASPWSLEGAIECADTSRRG